MSHYDELPRTHTRNSVDPVFRELCLACRTGDIVEVLSIISLPHINVNQMDEWNYSPLILASLCGHKQIVELLLSRGAVCDRDTYEGARCVYGALNDEIRNLLLSHDISKRVDVSQPFATYLSSLLNPLMELSNRDVCFYFPHVHGTLALDYRTFKLNRWVLSAASEFFRSKFVGEWADACVVNMAGFDPEVFAIAVDYAYLRTHRLPFRTKSDRMVEAAKTYSLSGLAAAVEKVESDTYVKTLKVVHSTSFELIESGRDHLKAFCNKLVAAKIAVPIGEEIDFEDIDTLAYATTKVKEQILASDVFPDIIVSVIDVNSDEIVYYPVQKAMLGKLEYFDAMFKSDLYTSTLPQLPTYIDKEYTGGETIVNRLEITTESLPVVQLCPSCTSTNIAEHILGFLYIDTIPEVSLADIVELLFASDVLLSDELAKCVVRLTTALPQHSVDAFNEVAAKVGYDTYNLIRVAWKTDSDRLEQHVTKYIALNLKELVQRERAQLLLLVKESAQRIRERQDTDTIELIDDIRYYLAQKYSVSELTQKLDLFAPSVAAFNADIEIIDELLEELDLEA